MLVLILCGIVGVLVSNGRSPLRLPLATQRPQVGAVGDEDADFYQTVEPQLAAAAREADSVAAMGERRSRNIFALRRAEGRLEDRLMAIDRATGATGVPPRFASAIDQYRQGADHLRAAIEQGRSAFARFDWENLDAAVRQTRQGADLIAQATVTLRNASRPPNPLGMTRSISIYDAKVSRQHRPALGTRTCYNQ